MSAILRPLSSMAQVIAAALFDGDGQCTASHLSPPYELRVNSDIMINFGEAFASFSALGPVGPARCFTADCETGSVVMRRVHDTTIFAFVERAANMANVNVALNLVGLELRRRTGASQTRSNRAASRAATTSLSHRDGPLQDVHMIQRGTLRRLLERFQIEVGPAAKLLLARELADLGVSARELPPDRYRELVSGISKRIPDQVLRAAFVEYALVLVPQPPLER